MWCFETCSKSGKINHQRVMLGYAETPLTKITSLTKRSTLRYFSNLETLQRVDIKNMFTFTTSFRTFFRLTLYMRSCGLLPPDTAGTSITGLPWFAGHDSMMGMASAAASGEVSTALQHWVFPIRYAFPWGSSALAVRFTRGEPLDLS